jgi:hypothetical protein
MTARQLASAPLRAAQVPDPGIAREIAHGTGGQGHVFKRTLLFGATCTVHQSKAV